jgi:hypothetical protein
MWRGAEWGTHARCLKPIRLAKHQGRAPAFPDAIVNPMLALILAHHARSSGRPADAMPHAPYNNPTGSVAVPINPQACPYVGIDIHTYIPKDVYLSALYIYIGNPYHIWHLSINFPYAWIKTIHANCVNDTCVNTFIYESI